MARPPIIHSTKELLSEKLRGIDDGQIRKRVGKHKTFVFMITKEKRDPNISILSDEFLEDFISTRLSQSTPERVREVTPISYAKGTLDELVIREQFHDEFAYLADDDDDEETQMSKNLKKIRTQPSQNINNSRGPNYPKPASNLANGLPKLITPKAGPSAQLRTASEIQPQVPLAHQQQTANQQQATAQTNGVVVEHKWTDTEARLNQGDLDNTYKDLLQQKEKIRSSDLAVQLLKQLALKCILLDETKWFHDTLRIIFGLNDLYQCDSHFWKELIQRLKTKLSSVAKYKSKANHEYVRGIYEEAQQMLSLHFYETNMRLDLHYSEMLFLTDPVSWKQHLEKLHASAPLKVEKKENSNPLPPILGERKIFKTEKRVPIFKNSRSFPVLYIKREIKRDPTEIKHQE